MRNNGFVEHRKLRRGRSRWNVGRPSFLARKPFVHRGKVVTLRGLDACPDAVLERAEARLQVFHKSHL